MAVKRWWCRGSTVPRALVGCGLEPHALRRVTVIILAIQNVAFWLQPIIFPLSLPPTSTPSRALLWFVTACGKRQCAAELAIHAVNDLHEPLGLIVSKSIFAPPLCSRAPAA